MVFFNGRTCNSFKKLLNPHSSFSLHLLLASVKSMSGQDSQPKPSEDVKRKVLAEKRAHEIVKLLLEENISEDFFTNSVSECRVNTAKCFFPGMNLALI